MEISVIRGEDREDAHIMGLFTRDDRLKHLQIEKTRDLELVEYDDGDYWQGLSGKCLANFTALRCGGCWADGNDVIVLEFDNHGHFRGWRK